MRHFIKSGILQWFISLGFKNQSCLQQSKMMLHISLLLEMSGNIFCDCHSEQIGLGRSWDCPAASYLKSHSHLTIPWCTPTDGRLLLLIPLMDDFLVFQLSPSITQRELHWSIFSECPPVTQPQGAGLVVMASVTHLCSSFPGVGAVWRPEPQLVHLWVSIGLARASQEAVSPHIHWLSDDSQTRTGTSCREYHGAHPVVTKGDHDGFRLASWDCPPLNSCSILRLTGP